MSSIVDSLADPYGDFYDVTSIFSKEVATARNALITKVWLIGHSGH